MLSKLWSFGRGLQWFYYQRRTPILVLSYLFGIGVIGFSSFKFLLSRVQSQKSHQRVSLFYETAQNTSDRTVESFIPNLYTKLQHLIEIPSSEQIKSASGKEAKLALWETLKVNSFTRIFCAIYSATLVEIFLRLQVNLLGRYLHYESVKGSERAFSNQIFISSDTQKNYVSHADYLIHTGLQEFVQFIQERVSGVLSQFPLQQHCTFLSLLQLILEIRKTIESSPASLLSFLLPPETEDEGFGAYGLGDENLLLLLNETRSVLESSLFLKLLHDTLNESFVLLARDVQQLFENNLTPNEPKKQEQQQTLKEPENITKPSPPSFPMIKILPIINLEFSQLLESKQNNPIIANLSKNPGLHTFGFQLFTQNKLVV